MTIKEAMYNAMCGKCIPYKKEVKKVFNDFIKFYDYNSNTYKDRVHDLDNEIEELKKENQKLSEQLEKAVNHTECLDICLESVEIACEKQKKYIEQLEKELKVKEKINEY